MSTQCTQYENNSDTVTNHYHHHQAVTHSHPGWGYIRETTHSRPGWGCIRDRDREHKESSWPEDTLQPVFGPEATLQTDLRYIRDRESEHKKESWPEANPQTVVGYISTTSTANSVTELGATFNPSFNIRAVVESRLDVPLSNNKVLSAYPVLTSWHKAFHGHS